MRLRIRASGSPEIVVHRSVLASVMKSPGLIVGLALFGVIIVGVTLGPMLSPYDPYLIDAGARLLAPSASHLFGTDNFGRDSFTRTVLGTRESIFVGIMVVLITGLTGALIGALAGYHRRLDGVLMRFMDALMAFPPLLLSMAIAAGLGSGLSSLVIALSVAYVPRTARLVRGTALVVREQQFVEAARVAGAGTARMLLVHIIPNCVSPLSVQLTFSFAYAILMEATLSYLGVGLPPPAPTLGGLIADGREYIVEAHWMSLYAGLTLTVAVLALNMIGDGLRDLLDPQLRVET